MRLGLRDGQMHPSDEEGKAEYHENSMTVEVAVKQTTDALTCHLEGL